MISIGKKGIILAGGTGSRLWPLTMVSSKHLLPIFNKPMIYYPLTTLMLGGVREFLLIAAETEVSRFKKLFGDGHSWGINIQYTVQRKATGIAKAFIIGASFIDGQSCVLILGDNIFYGVGIGDLLQRAMTRDKGATVFCHWVKNASRYSVLEFDSAGRAATIEEKPQYPKSNWAVTGLYVYDASVVDIARRLKPSVRGELEITDVNRRYLEDGELYVEQLGRGFAWLDTGTFSSLLDAANYVATLQRRQGLQIACLEEIAFHKGWITKDTVLTQAWTMRNSEYGRYLRELASTGY